MTWYVTIRPDTPDSWDISTHPLAEYLRTLPALVPTGPMTFGTSPGYPGAHVILAKANEVGSYRSDGEWSPIVSAVEIVGWGVDEGWYRSLAALIAAFIDCKALEERYEQNSDILLYM